MAVDRKGLDRAFNPRSVAVVGDKRELGYMWLRAMSQFQGTVYSVQIDERELAGIAALGVPNYPSLQDIPGPVDYVVCAVSRSVAPRIVADCIQKRVGGVTLFTAGFAETGTDEGLRLQAHLQATAQEAGLNLIGPNCMGIFNPRIGLRHSEDQYYGIGGEVGIISQSGTVATLFSLVANLHGVRVSKSVSYGNAIVLDSPHFLEYLASDDQTRAIGLYIEGVHDGRRLLRALRETAARKPVVALKGGQTEAGVEAAHSHTASLTPSPRVWQALFRQCGAIPVATVEEMIDTMQLLVHCPPVSGRRVGLAAMTGGQSVLIADAFAREGLEVPALSEASYRELASFFNTIGGSYRNPLDMVITLMASTHPVATVARLLRVLDQDPNVDCVVLEYSVLLLARRPDWSDFARDMAQALAEFRQSAAKPLLVVLTAGHREDVAAQVRESLSALSIPTFSTFSQAARALSCLVRHWPGTRLSSGGNPQAQP
ncbi:MAG: CoA-binding protein [Chloroflexi bacterium]|nr:CoA-binding protein [Chloroflexota bacterium]